MIKIKFSHYYVKLSGILGRPTYLIGVSECDISQLPHEFLFWDTLFVDAIRDKGKLDAHTGHYPLPKKGTFMVLTLCTPDCVVKKEAKPFQLFTTIRRFTPSKWSYYSNHIGEQVEIVITEGK
jgi:hypothetical protein